VKSLDRINLRPHNMVSIAPIFTKLISLQ